MAAAKSRQRVYESNSDGQETLIQKEKAMKKLAKKEEVKEVGELSAEHKKLISRAIHELDKAFTLGEMLSHSDRKDAAYAGQKITQILWWVCKAFHEEAPGELPWIAYTPPAECDDKLPF
jgi:hypothetical protein